MAPPQGNLDVLAKVTYLNENSAVTDEAQDFVGCTTWIFLHFPKLSEQPCLLPPPPKTTTSGHKRERVSDNLGIPDEGEDNDDGAEFNHLPTFELPLRADGLILPQYDGRSGEVSVA
ncbi:uncharacterized protein Z519_05291 [Cladophialophora bantiana CBS 173.52]|uniref:Uncharacterized protein n=1 Tax=Cladophialophora bantiana (strain ATCC 10958 / CBS 173.52 / CDC B-1940 / NIH 8579) TaxID=1442370 RepID=A0A0D2EVX9_CLAB1|nr:uncharacterized protein Z519_05291 [Cladophialophora bantiana CBS 173.52]KIW93976.1 hypothetical protein Z519_05291 [Cladophialophora bantiana CBS 173.52]